MKLHCPTCWHLMHKHRCVKGHLPMVLGKMVKHHVNKNRTLRGIDLMKLRSK